MKQRVISEKAFDPVETQPKRRRKRGEARTWQRGRLWWVQYYANGVQHRESSHSEEREVAERLLRKRQAEIEADTFLGPAARRLRYEQMRDGLVADYEVNKRKWLRRKEDGSRYMTELSHLDGFFAGRRAANITTDAIRRFIAKRQEKGAANGTINRSLALLRRMFWLAVEDGKLRSVPHFPMLKEAPPRRGFLEHSDFKRLRQELPEYLRALSTPAYYTGMRLGKILGLRWDNVDFQTNEIRLDPGTTKNDEPRTNPLIGELSDMLRIELEKDPDAEFIFAREGQRIGSFRKAWKSACKRAGLNGLLFHDLRRTGVRNLVRAGVPERVAMAISGHKTRAVFERYNIVSGRDLKEAANRLESYLTAQADEQTRRAPERFGDKTGTIEISDELTPALVH